MKSSRSSTNNSGIYGAVTFRFPYGLLVAADAESEEEHDDWDPATQVVHAASDSLFISVRPAESGIVEVVCVEAPYETGNLQLMFSGEISLSRANITLSEPGGTMHLEVPIERKHNKVAVFGDDSIVASRIVLVFSEPAEESLGR
ncbi:hypothetical protein [Streptomyces adustus]|uniref:hypothetical protein n=1 Tax=Streptomyces adustus TaxID=1609272 RepID=UPI00371B852D